jgi:hypothetical protein
VEAIRCGLRFKQENIDSFLQMMAEIEVASPEDSEVGEALGDTNSNGAGSQKHTKADLWLLFALLGVPSHAKKVQTLFKKKVQSQQFSCRLLVDAMHGYRGALGAVFDDLKGLAELLVRSAGAGSSIAAKSKSKASSNHSTQTFSCILYELLFSGVFFGTFLCLKKQSMAICFVLFD